MTHFCYTFLNIKGENIMKLVNKYIINKTSFYWIVLVISIIFYSISFMLPALLLKESYLLGQYVFKMGWYGIFVLNFAWYANPIYYFSIIAYLKKNFTSARNRAFISLIFGSFSFITNDWYSGGNVLHIVEGVGIGFYIWMVSFFIIFIGSLILKNKEN